MINTQWALVAAGLGALVVFGGDALAKKGGGGKPGGGGIADADVSVIYLRSDGQVGSPWKGDDAANTERAFSLDAMAPRFGPSSSTSLVYATASGADGAGIYTTNDFSGGGLTRVIGVTGSESVARPDWSQGLTPNGAEMIAFRDDDANGLHQVWVTSLDGSVVTQLTSDSGNGRKHDWPRWNPADSSQLVFGGLWLMDLAVDGNDELYATSIEDLSVGTAVEGKTLRFADFSPDGERIYFSAHYPDPDVSDIWVYDMQTETATNLTNQADGKSRWSPCERTDGKVMFVANSGRHPVLWEMNQDGTGRTMYSANDKKGESYPACRR